MQCPDCKGKKVYVGLNKVEQCGGCRGMGEVSDYGRGWIEALADEIQMPILAATLRATCPCHCPNGCCFCDPIKYPPSCTSRFYKGAKLDFWREGWVARVQCKSKASCRYSVHPGLGCWLEGWDDVDQVLTRFGSPMP